VIQHNIGYGVAHYLIIVRQLNALR